MDLGNPVGTGHPGTIDCNADLGEGIGDDEAMLALVTSANVACGGHAGDDASMARTVAAARRNGVVVGAHVSYPDRAGFGRTRIAIDRTALADSLAEQLEALRRHAGDDLRYVKPHGALYNDLADDASLATLVMDVVARAGSERSPLAVLTLPSSEGVHAAERAGVPWYAEGYADRAYTPAGRLVPRSQPGAVLHDPDEVAEQALRLAQGGVVQSLCIHGDTPGAVHLARRLVDGLRAAGIERAPFVGSGAGGRHGRS